MCSKGTVFLLSGNLVGSVTLLILAPQEAVILARRLAPIFLFVTTMSVVTNISFQAGVFDEITRIIERLVPSSPSRRQTHLWSGLVLVSIVVTVFLSLDTTAILVTPLAVAVAKRNGLNIVAVSFAVVWIANLASLPLPVSNLTNLLALNSPVFPTGTCYMRQVWFSAIVSVAVAVGAAWGFYKGVGATHTKERSIVTQRKGPNPLLGSGLVTLSILLPALASPIPYWISSTVAASALLIFGAFLSPTVISSRLVPWSSLLLAAGLSTASTLGKILGGAHLGHALLGGAEDSAAGLVILAGAGAVTSNLINNIPAFLTLETAVTTTTGYLALLIGVNAGPIVTPWASLATLLWHNQLLRAGVVIRWRTYVMAGIVLAPIAVLLPTGALILQLR